MKDCKCFFRIICNKTHIFTVILLDDNNRKREQRYN